VVFTDREHTTRVGKLYVPLLHTYIPDSLEIPFTRIRLSGAHLRFLADGLRPHAGALSFPPKVYIRRDGNTRNLSNAAEVEDLLKTHGFSALDPSSLDLGEQIALFANATDIIGVAGAAFANTIFCGNDAHVTAFYAYQNRDYPLQRLMCEAVGVEFHAFPGIRAPRTPDRWRTQAELHAQFEVDLVALDEHLTRFHARTTS
jgi:capsular polysaccharide biosynthesis protein